MIFVRYKGHGVRVDASVDLYTERVIVHAVSALGLELEANQLWLYDALGRALESEAIVPDQSVLYLRERI